MLINYRSSAVYLARALYTLTINPTPSDATVLLNTTGYVELEYIESTGTQYIDTGITNENCDTYGVKTKYYYTAVTGSSSLCGNYESNTGKASFGQIFVSAAHTGDAIFTGIGNVRTCERPNVPEQTDLTDEFTINCTAGTISRNFNGESLSGSGLDFSVRSSRHCLLFACNSASGAMQFSKARIYRFQVLKDGELVFNGIPAKRLSDNVAGIYDIVNGQFFANAGTGTFVEGPIISLPAGYTKLEYIESSGTQYIDTGIKVNQNTKIELQGIQGSGDSALFGISAYLYAFNSNNASSCYYGFCNYAGSAAVSFRGNPHTIVMSKADGFVLDGTVIGSLTDADNTESTYNVALFGRTSNADGTVNKLSNHRIYYCKLYNSGTLVRNFVPCKNASNVVGMYDTVSRQFFGNAGTGVFLAGPSLLPGGIYVQTGNSITVSRGTTVYCVANAQWYNTSITQYTMTSDLTQSVQLTPAYYQPTINEVVCNLTGATKKDDGVVYMPGRYRVELAPGKSFDHGLIAGGHDTNRYTRMVYNNGESRVSNMDHEESITEPFSIWAYCGSDASDGTPGTNPYTGAFKVNGLTTTEQQDGITVTHMFGAGGGNGYTNYNNWSGITGDVYMRGGGNCLGNGNISTYTNVPNISGNDYGGAGSCCHLLPLNGVFGTDYLRAYQAASTGGIPGSAYGGAAGSSGREWRYYGGSTPFGNGGAIENISNTPCGFTPGQGIGNGGQRIFADPEQYPSIYTGVPAGAGAYYNGTTWIDEPGNETNTRSSYIKVTYLGPLS